MEFVLVVPRTELFPKCFPHGFVPFGADHSEGAFRRCIERHAFFVEREYAERAPTLKQVIPYSIVVRRCASPNPHVGGGDVLCLRRTRRGGEARLHDKLSIGVGGHINPVDSTPFVVDGVTRRDPIAAATRREVSEEELELTGPWEATAIGLLNDDTNAVGAVHVGLVQVVTVDGSVTVRETDQLEGSFATVGELHRRLAAGANFETWSSLLIPQLDHLLPRSILTA